MRRSMIGFVMAALATTAGCGDNENESKGYGDPIATSELDQAAALGMVEAIASLDEIDGDLSGVAVLTELFGYSTALLNAKLLDSLERSADVQGAPPATADFSECASASDNLITYNDCEFAGIRVDGTIRYAEGMVDVALAIDMTSYADVSIIMDGAIHWTETAMYTPEPVRYDFIIDAGGMLTSYHVTQLMDLDLTDGCPTGGDMELHGEWEMEGVDEKFDVWVLAVFGPECGQVTIY